MKDADKVKNIIIGAGAVIIFILVLMLLSRLQKEGEKNEVWRVEGQVVKKEVITRNDEKNGMEDVYVIDCEDEDGIVHTFELTDAALDGKYDAETAYKEIKTGRAYRFKVGWQERRVMEKAGYYPSIYGAASLVDFNLALLDESTADRDSDVENKGDANRTENQKESSASSETARAAQTTDASETAKASEDERAEDTTKRRERETITSRSTEEMESPTTLEIGGIKIEPVEETMDQKLLESVEERVREELEESIRADVEESIRAELEESFEAERDALKEELADFVESRLQN